MNRPPHHLSDEALSAHADVASDRATRREVEDHLDSCDRCAARLETLSRARDALRGGLVEPVDQLARRRLVSRAVSAAAAGGAAGRPSRRVAILTAAAAVVVTVGVVGAARLGGDRGEPQLAIQAFGLPIGAAEIVEEAGALDDPSQLEAVLRNQVFVAPGGSGGRAAGSGGGSAAVSVEEFDAADSAASAGGQEAPSQIASADEATSGDAGTPATGGPPVAIEAAPTEGFMLRMPSEETLTAITRCYRAVAGSLSEESRLTAAATGSYSNQRVVVLGFRTKTTRLLAMVLSRNDCSIVTAQSFQ